MADLLLVIIEGPDAGREFDLAGAIVAGRDPEAGIVIEDAEASRRHASFSAEGVSVTVEDLGSTNGTFVNGERLSGSRTVGEGDRVRVGTTVFEIRSVGPQATSAGTAIPEPDDLQSTRVGGTAIPDAPPPTPTPTPQASSAPQGPPPAGPPAGGAPPPPPTFPPPQQPGAFAQPGQPPAPYGQSAMATGGYPVAFEVDYPPGGIDRWRPFLQGAFFPVLAIPHFIALFFVWIGAFFAWIAAFFAILFTGRYPRGLFDFLAGTMRWSFRVIGYTYLFTEAYPPFSLGEHPEYPIRVRIEYPEQGIARWRPLVHWLLAIPHYIVLYFLALAAFFAYIIIWFAIVFTRAYPPGLFNFMVGYHRWQVRFNAYILWMTEEYPPFGLG